MGMQQSTKLGISLSYKRGEILIFRNTIQALGNPKYIRLLFNYKEKKIAIQSLEQEHMDAFIVPSDDKEHWAFVICSVSFVTIIWKTCKWEWEATYRIYGMHHKKQNLVEFDLKESRLMLEGMEVVSDVIPLTPVVSDKACKLIEQKER